MTEANAVTTVVQSLALSRPEVGFFLRSDGRRSLALPAAADLREREREEILSELVPAMEARGYDAGAVKAVMGD